MTSIVFTGSTQALSPQEQAELKSCESSIRDGFDAFVNTGLALNCIKQRRLYREYQSTFAGYVRNKWHITPQYANVLIKAADFTMRLKSETVVSLLPTAASQVRPLFVLAEEHQTTAWQQAVDLANGLCPTAKLVRQVVTSRAASLLPNEEETEDDHLPDYADEPKRLTRPIASPRATRAFQLSPFESTLQRCQDYMASIFNPDIIERNKEIKAIYERMARLIEELRQYSPSAYGSLYELPEWLDADLWDQCTLKDLS